MLYQAEGEEVNTIWSKRNFKYGTQLNTPTQNTVRDLIFVNLEIDLSVR